MLRTAAILSLVLASAAAAAVAALRARRPPAPPSDLPAAAASEGGLRLSARFANERVVEARFLTRGCTAAIAAGSALTEWMAGKSCGELATLAAADIEMAVGGLEPASKHAAVLCVDAVRQLLASAALPGRGAGK